MSPRAVTTSGASTSVATDWKRHTMPLTLSTMYAMYSVTPLTVENPRTTPSMRTFFFQAEDGIGDGRVTGVQTCALPIFLTETLAAVCEVTGAEPVPAMSWMFSWVPRHSVMRQPGPTRRSGEIDGGWLHGRGACDSRSEERRVGRESRERWAPAHNEEEEL